MLLIFFLVTTSMDRDQGLKRQLPPPDNAKEVSVDVSNELVMRLRIDAQNRLFVNDSICDFSRLRQHVMDFVSQENHRTQHFLLVETDPKTAYETYFRLQNELVAAYNQLREKRARNVYHRAYSRCTASQHKALQEHYPQRIAEIYDNEPTAREGGKP